MRPTPNGFANLLLVTVLLVTQLLHTNAVKVDNKDNKKWTKRLRHRKEKAKTPKTVRAINETEASIPIISVDQDVSPRRSRRMRDVGLANEPKRWRKLQGNCYRNWNQLRNDMERRNFAEGRTFRICTGEMNASGRPIRLTADDVTVRCVSENRTCRWINRNLSGRFLAVRGSNFAMYDMTVNGRSKRVNGNGGCIAIQNSADHVVERTTFRNCWTNANGGAISSLGSLSLTNSDFINNRANRNGGAGGPAYIKEQFRSPSTGSKSSDGQADDCPNGVYFQSTGECRTLPQCDNRNPGVGNSNCLSELSDVRTQLERDVSGGTITLCPKVYNVQSTIEVMRTQFRFRCRPGNARDCILRSTFSNGPILRFSPDADGGQGVRQSLIFDITFENGNNNGDGNGGAIQIPHGFNNGINNCLFQNNRAKLNGGAIYCNDQNAATNTRLINNDFRSNEAQRGGACYMSPALASGNNRGNNNRSTGSSCDEIYNPAVPTCVSFSSLVATSRSSPLGLTPRIFLDGGEENDEGEEGDEEGGAESATSPDVNETATEEGLFASSFTPTSTPLFDDNSTFAPSSSPIFELVEDESEDVIGGNETAEDGELFFEPVDFDPR